MKRFAIYFLALLWSLSLHAQGIIWSVSNWSQQGSIPDTPWQMAIDHVANPLFATPPSRNPSTRIFFMRISTNDTGRTFVANTFNQPGFSGFVSGLTDGVNQYVRVEADNGSWQLLSEENHFRYSPTVPDLAGYNITQIDFRVDNFYEFYNASDDRYFRRLDYSLDFYGAPVPEPGIWALLGLGGAIALLLRRKARKQPSASPK